MSSSSSSSQRARGGDINKEEWIDISKNGNLLFQFDFAPLSKGKNDEPDLKIPTEAKPHGAAQDNSNSKLAWADLVKKSPNSHGGLNLSYIPQTAEPVKIDMEDIEEGLS